MIDLLEKLYNQTLDQALLSVFPAFTVNTKCQTCGKKLKKNDWQFCSRTCNQVYQLTE